jgi:hypothetical protein
VLPPAAEPHEAKTRQRIAAAVPKATLSLVILTNSTCRRYASAMSHRRLELKLVGAIGMTLRVLLARLILLGILGLVFWEFIVPVLTGYRPAIP